MDSEQYRLLPFVHEPETPCRPSIYGEGIFVECWKRHLAKPLEYGDGECEERFCALLGDLGTVTQRDAVAAVSFICWLGTNAGNSYLISARKLAEHVDRDEAYLFAWVRNNRRYGYVNGGRSTAEAILRVPAARDLEVISIVAEWLGTHDGQVFIKEAEAEIEATRRAIREKNHQELRARVRAETLVKSGAVG